MTNPIGWIEIPVTDMTSAIQFYNMLFGWDLKALELGPLTMAWLPNDHSGAGTSGSLVLNENYTPSQDGVLIYFNCADVDEPAALVEKAGGKLLRAKTQISPDVGYMALAVDSEGNRIAFHSQT